MTQNETDWRAVDFFCGAGGLTSGLIAAGIQVLAGIDVDASCQETYEANNSGAVFLERDLSSYAPVQLESDLRLHRRDDRLIFAGCAPCQFWSLIRTNREKSEKTKNLILEFQKFVEYFEPGYVVVENVPGISSKPDSPMSKFIGALEGFGYDVASGTTDMSLYGVPQRRRRFTLLASRVSSASLPLPRGGSRTVRDVLGVENGFGPLEPGAIDESDPLHSAAGLSKLNQERLKMTPKDGGDRSTWQNRPGYQLACYSTEEKKFYDTYGRMWWDRQSPTITTKFFSISNGRFAHPEEDRAISLREGAALQTFSRDYKFFGNGMASIARMIGNAVPPDFAKIIGEHIKSLAEDE
ncbi:MAG: DNA cytosine methyltransferase [Anaerolineales bacterium]|nr:DNA cytosine methyltransferase [Anaerolineales bacterium]